MSTNLAPLLSKGIDKHVFIEMQNKQPKRERIFHNETMTGRVLDRQTWQIYDSPQITLPLNPVHMSQIQPSFSKRYFPVKRTLGDVIAEEDWEDDQYGVLHRLIPARGGIMGRVFTAMMEYDAANFFAVTGFSTASPVPGMSDGVSLFSTSHPMSLNNSATTWSNRPSTDADLSHTTYYAAYSNLVQQMETNNYNIIENAPRCLVFNPTQRPIATQIAKGDWQRDTAQFQMNMGKLDNLDLVDWSYFRKTGATSAANSWNAWFVVGDEHYLVWADRQTFKSKSDYDINVQGYICVAYVRYDVGADDARGTYGSPGV